MCVIRFTTASWPATARARLSAEKASAVTGLAPSAASTALARGERASPLTVCPAATSSPTARRPITPVAPATMILTRHAPL